MHGIRQEASVQTLLSRAILFETQTPYRMPEQLEFGLQGEGYQTGFGQASWLAGGPSSNGTTFGCLEGICFRGAPQTEHLCSHGLEKEVASAGI